MTDPTASTATATAPSGVLAPPASAADEVLGDVDEAGRARPSGGVEVAVAALALAVLWIFFLGSVLGLALGLVALRRLRSEELPEGRRRWASKVALAAVVIGGVGTAFAVVVVLLMAAGIVHVTAACHPAVTGESCRLVVRRG